MSKTIVHVVKKGESLEGIATKYKFGCGKALFEAEANKKLRSARKKPELIQPGDRVVIPPVGDTKAAKKSVAELRNMVEDRIIRRVNSLNELIADEEKIANDLDRLAKSAQKTADNVDMAISVLKIGKGSKKLFDAAKKHSTDAAKGLEAANKKIVEEVFRLQNSKIKSLSGYDKKLVQKLEKEAKKADDVAKNLVATIGRTYITITDAQFLMRALLEAAPGGKLDKALWDGDIKGAWREWSRIVTFTYAGEAKRLAANVRNMNAAFKKDLLLAIKEDQVLLEGLKKIEGNIASLARLP